MREGIYRIVVLVVVVLAVGAPWAAAGPSNGRPRLDVVEIVRDLEAVPASASGAAATRFEAARRLLRWMRAAGLEDVEGVSSSRAGLGRDELSAPAPGLEGDLPAAALSGRLPGSTRGEASRVVFLVVTLGSPEAPDWRRDARASALALAAVSELAEVPRRHTVRLLLLQRAGATARAAGERWLGTLPAAASSDVLAAVDLDGIGWEAPGGGSVVRLTPIEGAEAEALVLTPAWLVHAVLLAAQAVERPLAVAAPRFGPVAQLLGRSTRRSDATSGEAFLAAGIPAVSFDGRSLWDAPGSGTAASIAAGADDVVARADRWRPRLVTLLRRLDVLEGRPRPDGEFLVWLGRVWSRRDLYWIVLAVWLGLVLTGLPGAWRGRSRGERVVLGRRYLAAFAARGLLLVALLALPVLGLFLLLPAALVWIATTLSRIRRRLAVGLALTPWAGWACGIVWLVATDRARGFAPGLPALALLGGALGVVLWALGRYDGIGGGDQGPSA